MSAHQYYRFIILVGFLSASQSYAGVNESLPWLDVKASGRHCPELKSIQLEAEGLLVTFADDFTLPPTETKRIERGFCQLSIGAVPKVGGRRALEFTGINLSGLNQVQADEDLRLDLTVYLQGKDNHWQHQVKISPAKDSSWQLVKTLPSALQFSCDEQRSLQFKVAIASRKGSRKDKSNKENNFHLQREWRLPVTVAASPCQP